MTLSNFVSFRLVKKICCDITSVVMVTHLLTSSGKKIGLKFLFLKISLSTLSRSYFIFLGGLLSTNFVYPKLLYYFLLFQSLYLTVLVCFRVRKIWWRHFGLNDVIECANKHLRRCFFKKNSGLWCWHIAFFTITWINKLTMLGLYVFKRIKSDSHIFSFHHRTLIVVICLYEVET